jgi:head-tail adaptor
MRTGQLDKRATFRQLAADTGDGMGGRAQRAWAPQFERWAELVAERGQEARDAGREASPRMATLTVRRDSQTMQVTPEWSVEITFAGVTEFWNIRSVNPFDRRSGLISMAVESGVAI